eukprot:6208267-Pleurochrysis_carterae.AAC.8
MKVRRVHLRQMLVRVVLLSRAFASALQPSTTASQPVPAHVNNIQSSVRLYETCRLTSLECKQARL